MTDQYLPRVAILLASLATIGCDRLTKHAAARMLADGPERSYFRDTVRLVYAENVGGFLSLGASLSIDQRMLVFTAATGLLLVLLLAAAIRGRWQGARLLGAALIIAGGASNWIDRLATGSVIDFVNIGIGPVRTGIFNIADVAILAGAGVLAFAAFTSDRQEDT